MTSGPETTLCVSHADAYTTSLHLLRQLKHDCKCKIMLQLQCCSALSLSWHVGMSAGLECKRVLTPSQQTARYVVQKRQRS